MRVIETEWNGCRFRSRLEARWAVIFSAMGIEWEYEPEGFILDDGTSYLPDFRLDNVILDDISYGRTGSLWVEVKGVMDDDDLSKIGTFSVREPILTLQSVPLGDTWFDIARYIKKSAEIDDYQFWITCGGVSHRPSALAINCDGNPELFRMNEDHDAEIDKLASRLACQSGTKARFEHGERPTQGAEFWDCLQRIKGLQYGVIDSGKFATLPEMLTRDRGRSCVLPYSTLMHGTARPIDITVIHDCMDLRSRQAEARMKVLDRSSRGECDAKDDLRRVVELTKMVEICNSVKEADHVVSARLYEDEIGLEMLLVPTSTGVENITFRVMGTGVELIMSLEEVGRLTTPVNVRTPRWYQNVFTYRTAQDEEELRHWAFSSL